MFDEKTVAELKYYVYMLIDPIDNNPFYVGKGIGNRVFNHVDCALNEKELEIKNQKHEKIREINNLGNNVKHVIIRHGLTDKEALQIEASIIDTLNFCGALLSNKVNGHNSIEKGLMTTEEIERLYNSKPMEYMNDDCIIININEKYKRGISEQSIYEATKEIWTIDRKKLTRIKYVLSEFRGLIVEVFKVNEWYEKERGYNIEAKKYGQTKIGYGFNGEVAESSIRETYINKSIAHLKKKGSASVIRYKI